MDQHKNVKIWNYIEGNIGKKALDKKFVDIIPKALSIRKINK